MQAQPLQNKNKRSSAWQRPPRGKTLPKTGEVFHPA
jgi:hypothetical protein